MDTNDFIYLHSKNIPVIIKFIKKSEYLVEFKNKKKYLKSIKHKTDKYIFRKDNHKNYLR